jgi:outer membrane protein OmpA-like peptidoglycan-associated protein
MQIIYFDFDKFSLSSVSAHKIKLFLNKYKNEINEYLVVGHTDTKGSKEYNLSLSIKRAEVVKNLLIKNGINHNKVKILGKGEESLAIITKDETKQPGNRRVEIKKTN